MIIALVTLSFAMIVGGLLSAVLGWDIVLVERGWTMVLAGSISAASGAILLGITAAISKLSKIQAELARLHSGLNEAEPVALAEAEPGMSLAALAGGLFGGAALGGAAAARDKAEEEPPLPMFPETEEAKRAEPVLEAETREEKPAEPASLPEADEVDADIKALLGRGAAPERELKVPDFLIAERYRETSYAEVRLPEREEERYAPEQAREDLFEAPAVKAEDIFEPDEEKAPEPAPEPEIVEPAPEADVETEAPAEAAAEIDVEPGTQAAQPEEAPAPRRSDVAVIGSYTSGDNEYVMFADGSIEAHTPRGLFNFKSLDELKEFIASGGESVQKPAT